MEGVTEQLKMMKKYARELDVRNSVPLLDQLVTGTIFDKTRIQIIMKRDDCPYLKANAHDGDWEMICTVDNEECNTNWEQYRECNLYNKCINGDLSGNNANISS